MDDSTRLKNNLTVREVCAIIKAANNGGVTKLKFGDLSLELTRTGGSHAVSLAADTAISAIKHEEITAKTIEQEEINFREEQLHMSFIENPELAEQLLADGELEDDGSDDGEHSSYSAD